MTTVTIPSAEVTLTVDQLIDAFKRLPPEEQQKVRDALSVAWQERFRTMMDRIASRYEANPLSDEDIEAEIDAVRRERHDSRHP